MVKGEYSWPDGRKYVGNYLKDKRHGYGDYTDTKGNEFKGNWKKGLQHGLGTYIAVG